MLRKSYNKGVAMKPLIVVILAVIIAGLIASISMTINEELSIIEGETEDELREQSNTIVLDGTAINPDEKLKASTWYVMLRAEHCQAITNYLVGDDITEKDEYEIAEELDEQLEQDEHIYREPLNVLIHANLNQLRNLECQGEDQLLNFAELRESALDLAEMDTSDIRSEIASRVTSQVTGALTSALITFHKVNTCSHLLMPCMLFWGDDEGYDHSVFEVDEANDMEGRFGTINFVVEDEDFAISNHGEDYIKRQHLPGDPGYLNFDEDESFLLTMNEEQYWGGPEYSGLPNNAGNLYFAPDPHLAFTHTAGPAGLDRDEIKQCENYPITSHTPYMEDVPVIAEEKIEEGVGDDINLRGVAVPPSRLTEDLVSNHPDIENVISEDIGDEVEDVAAEIAEDDDLSSYMNDFALAVTEDPDIAEELLVDEIIDSSNELCRGVLDHYTNEVPDENRLDFVFCSGTEGKIQANKGEPTNTGESTEFEHNYTHHMSYPFVSMSTDANINHACLDEYTGYSNLDKVDNIPGGGDILDYCSFEQLGSEVEIHGNDYTCGLEERDNLLEGGIPYYTYELYDT